MTITEFVLARIAEKESAARAVKPLRELRGWGMESIGHVRYSAAPEDGYPRVLQDPEAAAHYALHDPARVLAECKAQREIVKWVNDWPLRPAPPSSVDGVIQMLATIDADHPDYQQEWAL